ncbi:PLP-dependent aminotransferase family protein [Paucibacter sp. O1-1]|nr:PLP-dependent aminotransferase family protein [Paucibacter sp. O1-1]MDA3825079.1 PLP-dependent aminotransferase family protein [Paucibacter sp. O1-1]
MYQFTRPFVHPVSSPIRDVFKYLSVPGMISFAGGYPDPKLYDIEGLGEASVRAYKDSLGCLQYGVTGGIAKLKTEIVSLMAARGVKTGPENVVATTGSQQAFDLLLRVLVNEGDVVLVENPTYTNNILALRVQGARMVAIPSDGDGLDVEELERVLKNSKTDADRPKLLYTVPAFGNPTGAMLSLKRRLRLLELAVRYRFVIAEDDPYGDLRFSDDAVPSLRALVREVEGSEDWVVHMASLSKIVSPGLRVAWSVSPFEIARRCEVAKQSADVGSSPWTQAIAAEYLASGRLGPHLERIRHAYREKCHALCASLRKQMADAVSFHEPQGGMFVWARLKGGMKSGDLLKAAIEQKVVFVPGTGFHVNDADDSTFRLSFSTPSVPDIEEGVIRLSKAWETVLAAS